MQWRFIEDDIRHINEQAISLEPTKRNVISLATTIYDPLGTLSPLVVRFKMLFQQHSSLQLSWDEHLSGELTQLQCGLEQAQPIRHNLFLSLEATSKVLEKHPIVS